MSRILLRSKAKLEGSPWGFDPATLTVPVLLMHGAEDGVFPASHSEWLAEHTSEPVPELILVGVSGHERGERVHRLRLGN